MHHATLQFHEKTLHKGHHKAIERAHYNSIHSAKRSRASGLSGAQNETDYSGLTDDAKDAKDAEDVIAGAALHGLPRLGGDESTTTRLPLGKQAHTLAWRVERNSAPGPRRVGVQQQRERARNLCKRRRLLVGKTRGGNGMAEPRGAIHSRNSKL